MMKNFLGIDWGEKKIGVALAHEETRLALPYGIVKHDGQVLETIGTLLGKEEIGTVVIGIHRKGVYDSERTGERFGELLHLRFGVAVAYQDEMFTSKLAQQNLIARGEKNVAAHDDAEAASILLQSWLDKK